MDALQHENRTTNSLDYLVSGALTERIEDLRETQLPLRQRS